MKRKELPEEYRIGNYIKFRRGEDEITRIEYSLYPNIIRNDDDVIIEIINGKRKLSHLWYGVNNAGVDPILRVVGVSNKRGLGGYIYVRVVVENMDEIVKAAEEYWAREKAQEQEEQEKDYDMEFSM